MFERALVVVSLSIAVLPTSDAAAEPAEAQETLEYVVQPGDTCARISERFFGDKRKWGLIHAHNPGMGPTPHKLAPGRVLVLPVLGQGPDAHLTDARRAVQTRAPRDPGWHRARAGKELYSGWRVNTLERASADVTFQDGSIVQMRQHTLIIIYGGKYRPARRRTAEASLERGTLRSRLGEFRLNVTTPNAAAGLEGGSSVVSVDEEGTSYLSHHDGPEARFKLTKGKAVRVKPGFGSKARKGDRRPSEPRPLPSTPVWHEEVSQTFVGLAPVGGSLRGSWSAVETATSYRIEVSSGRDGDEVVLAATVPSSVTNLEVHRLPEGTYFARVSAVDPGGFESPQSGARVMTVRLLELESPGPGESSDASADPEVLGDPPPPPKVLPGTRVVSPDGLGCGAAKVGKAPSFILSEAGLHELTCASSDGVVSSTTDVIVVAPSMRLLQPEHKTPLVRDAEPQRVLVLVQSELPLPNDARFRVPDGVTLHEVSTVDDERALELAASAQSPDEFALELVTGAGDGGAVLASMDFEVIDSPELDFAPNEALGLSLSPNSLGLSNDRREGSGPFFMLAYRDGPAAGEQRWRLNLGAEVAPIRRLRFGAAVPIDVHTSGVTPLGAADQAILVWAGYRILMRSDFSLQADLSVWFPTGARVGSISRTRFMPSLEASYAFNRRWLFRTRQGAILSTGSSGPFLWASAYGLDIKIVRLLAISGELDVVLGTSSGQAVTGVGGGPGLSLLLGPARLYFAARFAATEDFRLTNGRTTLTGGLRLAF